MDERAKEARTEKRPYEAPAVKKVHLAIKNAVLSVCHSSTISDPIGPQGQPCSVESFCYTPPT